MSGSKQGMGAAFEILVERYQGKVYRLAKAMTQRWPCALRERLERYVQGLMKS